MTTRTGLCIGGPLDGDRLSWDRTYYETSVMPPLPIFAPEKLKHLSAATEVATITTYVQLHIGAPADFITVWHPSDQSPADTARKLVQAYQNEAARKA
jgi:hypothetical protein